VRGDGDDDGARLRKPKADQGEAGARIPSGDHNFAHGPSLVLQHSSQSNCLQINP
jgi:hypothetical protein